MHEGGHAAREIKVIACIFSLSPTQPHTHVTGGCMRPTCPPTCSGTPPTPPSKTLSLSPAREVLLCPAGQGCRGLNVSNNSFALQMPLDLEITSKELVLRKLQFLSLRVIAILKAIHTLSIKTSAWFGWRIC